MRKITVCRKGFTVMIMAIFTMTLLIASETGIASTSTNADILISGEVEGSLLDVVDVPFRNVVVRLFSEDMETTCITQTDDNGMYHFSGLPLGVYTVYVDESMLRSDIVLVMSPDGYTDNLASEYTFALTADNPTIDEVDFVYAYYTSRSSTKHNERISVESVNCAPKVPTVGGFIGAIDSPDLVVPLPFVTVSLLNASGNLVTETTTSADGTYLFSDLEIETYTVVVDRLTLPAEGNFASPVYSPDADGDQVAQVAMTESDLEFRSQDFVYDPAWDSAGDTPPMLLFGTIEGSLGGILYGRSTLTLPPLPLENVTVILLDSNFVQVDETTTDAEGNYRFAELAPGEYTIVMRQETFPGEYDYRVISAPDDGTDSSSTLIVRANALVNDSQDFVYEYYFPTAVTLSNHTVTSPSQLLVFVIIALAVVTVGYCGLTGVRRSC